PQSAGAGLGQLEITRTCESVRGHHRRGRPHRRRWSRPHRQRRRTLLRVPASLRLTPMTQSHAGNYASLFNVPFAVRISANSSCPREDTTWFPGGIAVVLAALAAVTHTIRLGTLVNCVLYRSAFEVAKHAVDVDRISGGRAILGVGADDERECRQFGIT